MPRSHKKANAPKESDVDEFEDDEPIPAKRDTRIFHRDKDDGKHKDEEFEEDVFV